MKPGFNKVNCWYVVMDVVDESIIVDVRNRVEMYSSKKEAMRTMKDMVQNANCRIIRVPYIQVDVQQLYMEKLKI